MVSKWFGHFLYADDAFHPVIPAAILSGNLPSIDSIRDISLIESLGDDTQAKCHCVYY